MTHPELIAAGFSLSHSSLNDPELYMINQRSSLQACHARVHTSYIRGRDQSETEELFHSPILLQGVQICTNLPVIDTTMSKDQNTNSLTEHNTVYAFKARSYM